jgi:NADH:ubiquinone oxidoreductase subunit 6 (subunit J)
MSKLEKRIILFAILFIVIYLGAIVVTLQSRKTTLQKTTRIESAVVVSEEEAPLMLAELLLPMAVLSTLTLCFILARRRRSRTYQKLDDTEEAGQ